MASSQQRNKSRRRPPLGCLICVFKYVLQAVLIGWSSLAIYYSNLPWSWLRLVLALGFAAFGICALWIIRKKLFYLIFAVLFIVVLIWWSTIRPTHHRDWRPEVAVMPHATIEGDKVHIMNVRDFNYRSRDDFDVHYENREVLLSHLTGVDFYVSYWMPGPVGHTFLSFIFDNAPPVSISIETRPVKGQGFDPIASLFKQFELIYVVGDEQDLVRIRTNFRNERVFLYRVNIPPEKARRLFLVYIKRINELYDHPEFYNLLSNSCTINIIRYANKAGRDRRFDYRHFLNGWIDGYLYSAGWLNNDIPFEELRQRSYINPAAKSAGYSADFSKQIRKGLPAT